MGATARTSIYVGYADKEDEMTARALIQVFMRQANLPDYTLYTAQGNWNGEVETAIIIEVIGDTAELNYGINEVAHRLRYNVAIKQDAVYIVRELVDLTVV